jgi:hypothetical protein
LKTGEAVDPNEADDDQAEASDSETEAEVRSVGDGGESGESGDAGERVPVLADHDERTPLRELMARAYFRFDRRVLGLFRIYFAGALLYELIRRARHTTLLFSNEGVLPNHFVQYAPQGYPQFSIYLPFSEPSEVGFAFALTGLVYVLLGLGFHTRVMSMLAFFCAFSLNTRNLFLEDGGCAILSITAAWAMFLPLGDRFSIDAIRKSVRAELEDRPLSREAITAPFVSVAVLGIVLQFALIYFFNALHKKGVTWRGGSAVHYVLWQNRLNTSLAAWFRLHEPGFFSPLLSYGTLALEAALPALVLSPYHRVRARTVAVLLAISFHVGIALTMTLGPFSYAMIGLDLLLLPGEALDYLRDRFLGTQVLDRDGVVIRYRRDHLGARWVAALYRALSGGRISLRPTKKTSKFKALLGLAVAGEVRSETDAGALLVLRELLPRPTQLVAALVAEPLARLNFGWDAKVVPLPRRHTVDLSRAREVLAAVFTLGMLLQMSVDNPAVPKWLRIAPPGPLKSMNDYPRLIQAWNMFSPNAPTDDGALVVDAVTASGRHVDPFTGQAPDFERVHEGPIVESVAVSDYLANIRTDNNKRYQGNFERYIFDWHAGEQRVPADRIVSYEAFWVSHDSPKPGSTEPTNKRKELVMARSVKK